MPHDPAMRPWRGSVDDKETMPTGDDIRTLAEAAALLRAQTPLDADTARRVADALERAADRVQEVADSHAHR